MKENKLSQMTESPPSAIDDVAVPLFVDMDGTLVKVDLLFEGIVSIAKKAPWLILSMIYWLAAGKACLKKEIARRATLDTSTVPLQTEFIEFLRNQKNIGRNIYLATASDQSFAEALASRVGLFDGVISSDGRKNMRGVEKLHAILAVAGDGPFDYAGNARADLPVWARARRALVVNPEPTVLAAARKRASVERVFDDRPSPWRAWGSQLRLHQWAKNLLLGVPLLTAHAFDVSSIILIVIAFLSIGLIASSTYILNDLFDIQSDRHHQRKRNRPIAAGNIQSHHAAIAAVILLLFGLLFGALVSVQTLMWLILYLCLTICYSLFFKRYMILDVLILAGLYTIRIMLGAAALDVTVSSWLLAFSMFVFLSLAFVKRSAEIIAADGVGRKEVSGRGYIVLDNSMVCSMGVSSGYMAVLVLALFIDSQEATIQYSRPFALWLLCPLILYWISRIWMKTSRGEMHDDPLVYSLRDRASWIILAGMVVVILLAI